MRRDFTQAFGRVGELGLRRQQVGTKAKYVSARIDDHAAPLEFPGPGARFIAAHDNEGAAVFATTLGAHAVLA